MSTVSTTIPELVPYSGQVSKDTVRDGLKILQLNAEGLTNIKISVIEQICLKYKVSVILLQETHITDCSKLKVTGFDLAASTMSNVHGTATFIKSSLKWKPVDTVQSGRTTEWSAVEIDNVIVINVYKPPTTQLTSTTLPSFDKACIYAGDFNCHITILGVL
jgi:exonuclease III